MTLETPYGVAHPYRLSPQINQATSCCSVVCIWMEGVSVSLLSLSDLELWKVFFFLCWAQWSRNGLTIETDHGLWIVWSRLAKGHLWFLIIRSVSRHCPIHFIWDASFEVWLAWYLMNQMRTVTLLPLHISEKLHKSGGIPVVARPSQHVLSEE